MQQRYYDSVLGRFYSNDPVGFMASNPMMFNRYAYANNNPYRYTDPDGRNPFNFSDNSEFSSMARNFISASETSVQNGQQQLSGMMPDDPSGVAIGAAGLVASGVASPTGIGGALIFAASADQIVSAWTGKDSLVEQGITSAASSLGASDDVSATAWKIGEFSVSLATGGMKSMVDTIKGTGNAADAAGTASTLKDSAEVMITTETYGVRSCPVPHNKS